MATFALVVSLAALLTTSSAQSTNSNEHIWSSVAYLYHGERTPLRGSLPPSLTSFGTQQMFEQGSMFRVRYLDDTNMTTIKKKATSFIGIEDIERNALDNSQVSILTNNDGYTSISALAFMQGLYPPITQAFADSNGGIQAAQLANGTLINYPLGGYQYPNMQVLSELDPNSVWIEGHVACTSYQESILKASNSAVVQQVYNQTLNFYRIIWQKILANAFPINMASFYYAYDLYDYASYQFAHNNKTRQLITSVDLAMMYELASTQQRNLNGNLSVSGHAQGDMIRAISGRMLAAKVVTLFKQAISSSGTSNKLNLMFGSFEPFVAFFALSGLVNGPSAGNFQPLPSPGAAMVFELFSVGGNASVFPTASNLWVRFLYRSSTVAGTPFLPYPLFGNGNQQAVMRFSDFVVGMQSISIDSIAGWCNVCDPVNLFCPALKSNTGGGNPSESGSGGGGSNGSKLAPATAGVIGAVVTIAAVGLVFLAAMLCGGVRFYRADKDKRNATLGGFKGAEKMASDTDVAYIKNGARHERTGSWELRDGGKDSVEEGTVTKVEAGLVMKKNDGADSSTMKNVDDDAISVMGHAPVKPAESF